MNAEIPKTMLLLSILACGLAILSGCRSDPKANDSSHDGLAVPHGYMARLEQVHDGQLIGFGPFVGYYFRPVKVDDLGRLRFVCFNENRFYSSDMPEGAKLYEGTAVRVTLPQADVAIPTPERINPIYFEAAPEAWRRTRPDPRELFVHFHSCYNARGAVQTGYWLSHVAVADFTYDMGGRVAEASPLYHRVRKGADRDFARIIEFDRGPPKDD